MYIIVAKTGKFNSVFTFVFLSSVSVTELFQMAHRTIDGFSSSNAGLYNGSSHGLGYSSSTLPGYGSQRPVPMPRTKRKGKNAGMHGRRSPVAVPTTPIFEEEAPRSLTPPPDFVTDPDEEKIKSARHPLSTKGSDETFGGHIAI